MATVSVFQPRSRFYPVDNLLIDEWGKIVGAQGVAVYNALVRYANRATGVAFPSIGTIAKNLKLGRTTVKKYLRVLLNVGLIAINPRRSAEGDPTSNSYLLLDPSPQKVAQRKRQLEALLVPQHGTDFTSGASSVSGAEDSATSGSRGRSLSDLPPYPSATDPQSAADPEQSSSFNKTERTIADSDVTPTKKQQTCPHPASEIVFLPDNVTICHHCYGLLDDNLKLISCLPSCLGAEREETIPAERVESDRVCAGCGSFGESGHLCL